MITEFWLRATQCLQQFLAKRLTHEKGQGLVEYALILCFIAIVVVASLKFLQPAISTQLNNVANGL
jgi:Flp pilus assembly pilin Flp